jgi:hypothetical protein
MSSVSAWVAKRRKQKTLNIAKLWKQIMKRFEKGILIIKESVGSNP